MIRCIFSHFRWVNLKKKFQPWWTIRCIFSHFRWVNLKIFSNYGGWLGALLGISDGQISKFSPTMVWDSECEDPSHEWEGLFHDQLSRKYFLYFLYNQAQNAWSSLLVNVPVWVYISNAYNHKNSIRGANVGGSCRSNQADMMMWENLILVCIFVKSGLYLVCILAKKWSVFGLYFLIFGLYFLPATLLVVLLCSTLFYQSHIS